MRVELGTLGTDGAVDIADTVAFLRDERDSLAQQNLAIDVLELSPRIGKMETDIAHIGSAEEGIADGMNEHIGIAVT